MPQKRRQRRQRNPFGANPMPSVARDVGRVAIGVAGIGAMTTLGFGALNAMKPQ